MLGLKNLMTKETLREKIESNGGEILGQEGGSSSFGILIREKIPLHIAIEKMQNWKEELEQMEEFCENFKFDDKTAKELNMRIINSRFGLCVVKKTQTVIMKHPTGRNQFRIYGPLYNVENFVLTGNTKQPTKDLQVPVQEQKAALRAQEPQFIEIVKKTIPQLCSKFLERESAGFIIEEKKKNAHEIESVISGQLMTVRIKLPCPQRIIKEITANLDGFILDLNQTYEERLIENEMGLFLAQRLNGNIGVLENRFNVVIEELKSEEMTELIVNPSEYVNWSYESDSGEYVPYCQQHQLVIEDFYIAFRKAVLLKQKSYDKTTTLPFIGAGYIYQVLISNGQFIQLNPETGKRRKMRRERMGEKPRLAQKKQNQIKWYFEGDNGFELLSSQQIFQNWFKTDSTKPMKYSFAEWNYEIEKKGDYFYQKNLKTSKERRIVRKVAQVVTKYETIDVPNYSTLVPITRYKFQIKGKKDCINQFASYLLNEIAKEMNQFGIEFIIPKEISLNDLKRFQLEQLYVRVDQISCSSTERRVVLRGLKRLQARNKFQQFIDRLMKKEVSREGIEYPIEWTQVDSMDYSKAKLVDLREESKEYLKIEKHFSETLPQDKVTRIQRIQSKRLWQKHVQEKEDLAKRGRPTKEVFLFHGTPTDIKEILNSEEGLDLRFSNEGLWGRGVYFANRATYSKSYARKGDKYLKKSYYIFYCSVLRGDSVKLSSNSSLTIPPKKDSKSLERYDSVIGEAQNTEITIVYSNSKAYPSYVIHFDTEC